MRMGVGALALCLAAGCVAEEGGSLVITEIAAREDDCSVSSTPQFKLSGDLFDVRGGAFSLAPLVRNEMVDATDNELPIDKDVVISGFRTCWFEVADRSGGDAQDLDCDDLPADQRAFLTAAGSVPANGGTAVFSLNILDQAAREALWSGGVPPDPAGTGVIVKVQAVGQTASGEGGIESNWFIFGIDVCSGCLADVIASRCGSLACLGAGSCLPFQGQGTIVCNTVGVCAPSDT